MTTSDTDMKVRRLYAQYGKYLDDANYEAWMALFEGEKASYFLHPRENRDAGLDGYWMYCRNKAMIRDRIKALVSANIFNIHHNRHLITDILWEEEGSLIRAEASFLIIQTDVEGRSEVFAAGKYVDQIQIKGDGTLGFFEKISVPDSFNIQRPLAVPM